MEILRMNGDLDELVHKRATGREIRLAAVQNGFNLFLPRTDRACS